MRYRKHPTLIARPATGDFWDNIKGIGTGALNIFSSGEQAKGAAAVLTAQQQAILAQQQAQNQGLFGMSTGTLLILAGAGVGIYFLIKRKKSAS